MENTDLEMFMVKLRWLLYEDGNNTPIGNNPLIEAKKPEIGLLYEELGHLIGSCFKDQEQHDAGNLRKRLVETASQAEDIVDMFISSAVIKNDDSLSPSFEERTAPSTGTYGLLYCDSDSDSDELISPLMPNPVAEDNLLDCSLTNLKYVMDDLKSIREEILMSSSKGNLFQKHLNPQDMIMDKKIDHESAAGTTCSAGNTSATHSATEHEELIVGFEDDELLILDRLTGNRKKLDMISIVGMGGLGKTTLATKIFNESYVKYHFDKRGWATVSQTYSKRDLLLQVLTSIGKSVDKEATDSKLCQVLYQSLKGRRYLIVIDDIWSREAWDDLKICFPDDKTGSRVLVTTRLTEVSLHISPGGFTHNLGHLSEDHSWELLCKKTFRGHECPESLIETGKHIATKCAGLPLALVVIAGVLDKGEKKKDLWEKIEESVGSYIINDPVGCLDTLALSYDHLPSHLKKCFLYVGGLPEDIKLLGKWLILLWMAEGFIQDSGQRSLEEEGEYYLMDLIDRNLLIVAERRSNGGIKSCRMHDLLREVCLKKASGENFFKKVRMPNTQGLDSDTVSSIVKHRRLFIDYEVLSEIRSHDFSPHTRSLLCFHNSLQLAFRATSWVPSFLLLRVLHLLNIPLADSNNIRMLVHLRYLAVQSDIDHGVSFLKANLRSLQTLIVKLNDKRHSFMCSPDSMVNLRLFWCDRICIPNDFSVPTCFNLKTISKLVLDNRAQRLLESFPEIKKLGCSVSSESSIHGLLSFSMLTRLEALTVDTYMHESIHLANPIRFPENLRKLTLEGLRLPWSHMSTIQQLPNLEVLKLLKSSFMGRLWKTGDEQFYHLKFLKFDQLSVRVWEASNINFPSLRKLVVTRCRDLDEIPLALGYISTLEQIEIDDSNSDVLDSVNRIQEAQHEIGNYDIHVKILDG